MKGLPPSQGMASICFISVVPVERELLPGGQIMESWAGKGHTSLGITSTTGNCNHVLLRGTCKVGQPSQTQDCL